MTNANTLERRRPHPPCTLTAHSQSFCSEVPALGELRCLLRGVANLKRGEDCNRRGGAIFVVLWLSLRRCSTPALSAFRGLLLITSYMTIGMGSLSLLFVIPAVAFA